MFEPGIPVEAQGCALGKVDPDIFFDEDTQAHAAHVCIAHCPLRVRVACHRHAEDTAEKTGFAVDTVQAGLLWPSVGHEDQSPRDIEPISRELCVTCTPPKEDGANPYDHPGNWPYRRCRACDQRVRANPDTLLVGLHVDMLKVCPGSNQQPARLYGLGNKACKMGHEYTIENAITLKDGRRLCRTCRARQQRRSRERRAAGKTNGKVGKRDRSRCMRGHPRDPEGPRECRVCRSMLRSARNLGLSMPEYERAIKNGTIPPTRSSQEA